MTFKFDDRLYAAITCLAASAICFGFWVSVTEESARGFAIGVCIVWLTVTFIFVAARGTRKIVREVEEEFRRRIRQDIERLNRRNCE